MKKYALIAALCLLPFAAWAEQAKDLAEDPVVEKRMVKLAENLRCLVCQNESLASSHAELAEDLRKEVREMIKKGMTDKEITDYLVQRYGDFVLYEPPMKASTVFLWFGPFALLLIGAGVLFYQLRKRRKAVPEATLSAEEQQRAAALLNDREDKQA
jgi:cytochrome c-type biogenesis protein CcmH